MTASITARLALLTVLAGALPSLARAQQAAPKDAQLAAQPEVIRACYVRASGTIYRIGVEGSPDACRGGHIEMTWNVSGAQGEAGPQGPQGPQGPAGPAGSGSALAPSMIVRDSVDVAPGRFARAIATCPSGKTMVAGGFQFSFFDRAYTKIVGSEPVFFQGSALPNGWAAEAFNDDLSTGPIRRVYAYALCASPQQLTP